MYYIIYITYKLYNVLIAPPHLHAPTHPNVWHTCAHIHADVCIHATLMSTPTLIPARHTHIHDCTFDACILSGVRGVSQVTILVECGFFGALT